MKVRQITVRQSVLIDMLIEIPDDEENTPNDYIEGMLPDWVDAADTTVHKLVRRETGLRDFKRHEPDATWQFSPGQGRL